MRGCRKRKQSERAPSDKPSTSEIKIMETATYQTGTCECEPTEFSTTSATASTAGFSSPPRPSIIGLFKNLTGEFKTFIRQEVDLAKTEISEKVSMIGKNVASIAIGGFIAYAGLIVLLIGLGWL